MDEFHNFVISERSQLQDNTHCIIPSILSIRQTEQIVGDRSQESVLPWGTWEYSFTKRRHEKSTTMTKCSIG